MFGFIEKIMNSEIMVKIKNAIHNFINSFGKSGVKEKVDTFVEDNKSEQSNIIVRSAKKVKKFVSTNFNFGTGNKILRGIGKVISVVAGLGFATLVFYMAIKLLPEIIMMVAMIFAIVISAEFIMAILNRAVQ